MYQALQSIETYSIYVILIIYFLAMLVYWLAARANRGAKFAYVLSLIGWSGNTVALIARTMRTQRLPLSNGHEFIIAFCWAIVLILLYSEFRFKLKMLGAFVMPIPFLLISYVIMLMAPGETAIRAIPPALKSYWLVFHVITAILAYGAFAVSFGLGLMYILKTYYEENVLKVELRLPPAMVLDELSYKIIIFGFSFLTLVIITGAIWANYAWGTYWSWDPKETWSLITWIIYAGYLHARLMLEWKGKRVAWLAILGFVAILFTFFGVNYLLPGLHSYA